MTSNPFKPATAFAPRVKALFYGPIGAGKSHLAVSTACDLAAADGKRAAVISCEAGVEYLQARGLDFDVLPFTGVRDLEGAIEYLASDEGAGTYGAVVIDAATVIYHALQETYTEIAEKRSRDADDANLTPREWGKIRAWFDRIGANLLRAPQHIIVSTREKDEKNKAGDVLGQTADIHKTWLSLLEIVGRVTKDAQGVRTLKLDKGRSHLDLPAEVKNPSAETFAWARRAKGASKVLTTPAEAGHAEAGRLGPATPKTKAAVRELLAQLRELLPDKAAEISAKLNAAGATLTEGDMEDQLQHIHALVGNANFALAPMRLAAA